MNKTIHFADLECILFQLDFQRSETAEGSLIYTHTTEGSQLIFPPYQAEETVLPHHWMKTRWQLDGHGLMDSERFNQIIDTGITKGLFHE